MVDPEVQIVLFKQSHGIVSQLIKWQTDSGYCHAALLFNETVLIESMAREGVRTRVFNDYDPKAHDVYSVSLLLPDEKFKVFRFAEAQLGKGYDYWGCLRFISRRRLPDNERWFCSELVFEAFLQAGVRLLNNVEPYQVAPGDLATSPYLYKVN